MKYLKLALYAVLLSLAVSAPLFAADLGGPKPAVAAEHDDGLPQSYTVWGGGYASLSAGGSFTNGANGSAGNSISPDIFTRYGVGIGYDIQRERLVYGALLRGEFGEGKMSPVVGIRLGYALNQYVLPYATATLTFKDNNVINNDVLGSARSTSLGAGGGLEVRVADKITVFTELSRSLKEYGSFSTAPASNDVRAGVRLKF